MVDQIFQLSRDDCENLIVNNLIVWEVQSVNHRRSWKSSTKLSTKLSIKLQFRNR